MLKPRLRYFRHPQRTLDVARRMLAAHFEMHAFADHGERRFAEDPRYDLQNVDAGFACRQDIDTDDTVLLNRICAAYQAALAQPSPPAYRASGWWQQIRDRSLRSVRQALSMGNIAALHGMYRNFFRDACCTGLTAVPYGMTRVYFAGKMTDLHRRVYLADTLYRLDYWQRETGGRFPLRDLAIPQIGNPFGVCIDGTLVSARAEFQHRCADRIAGLLESETSTVVEVGGGFGGMAYFLLRGQPKTKYLNFDLPESIALATYYLMKAFPAKKFLLFGEAPLTEQAIADADVVLMPLSAMERLRTASVDLTFSSHAMTDLESAQLSVYLQTIHRVTRDHFLFIGAASLADDGGVLHLKQQRSLRWSRHRPPHAAETEALYTFDRANEERRSVEGNLAHVDR